VLLDDCNALTGMSFELPIQITRIDNATGRVTQMTRWDKSKRGSQKSFRARSRAEVAKLKKLLLSLRGRQKSFYIPTFASDLLVTATLSSGSSTMDVENIGYVRFVQDRERMRTFRITFTDGTSLFRVIQSSVQLSSTTERLTLDTTWPSTRPASEVQRVEFIELVRFDTDDMVLEHDRSGSARLRAPVRTIDE
jgi:hypothetical protein